MLLPRTAASGFSGATTMRRLWLPSQAIRLGARSAPITGSSSGPSSFWRLLSRADRAHPGEQGRHRERHDREGDMTIRQSRNASSSSLRSTIQSALTRAGPRRCRWPRRRHPRVRGAGTLAKLLRRALRETCPLAITTIRSQRPRLPASRGSRTGCSGPPRAARAGTPQRPRRHDVEPVGRLVEHDVARLVHERAGDRGVRALPLRDSLPRADRGIPACRARLRESPERSAMSRSSIPWRRPKYAMFSRALRRL